MHRRRNNAVIGADELVAVHAAEGERGAAMHAEIVEGMRGAGGIARGRPSRSAARGATAASAA